MILEVAVFARRFQNRGMFDELKVLLHLVVEAYFSGAGSSAKHLHHLAAACGTFVIAHEHVVRAAEYVYINHRVAVVDAHRPVQLHALFILRRLYAFVGNRIVLPAAGVELYALVLNLCKNGELLVVFALHHEAGFLERFSRNRACQIRRAQVEERRGEVTAPVLINVAERGPRHHLVLLSVIMDDAGKERERTYRGPVHILVGITWS